MNEFALKLLNMSISAGWMVLAVILLRLLLKKAPKWLMVLAWGLVGLRLLLPFTIPSPLSLIPSEETVRIESGAEGARTVIDSGIPAVDGVLNPALRAGEIDETRTPVSFDEETAEEKTPEESEPAARSEEKENAFPLLGAIWAAGAVVMLLYAAASYLSLRRSVGDAIRTEKGIYRSDGVKSPFILGLFRPRIYLPSSMDEKTAGYVIAHEKAHLERKDHWWKPVGYLLLAVYWFHPLLWVAYVFLCRDIEFAADEKAIREKDREWTATYSSTLLAASMPRRRVAACPLAFGEVGTKTRIKSLLNYKKPAFWIVIAAVLALAAVAVCLLTGPMRNGQTPDITLSDEVRLALEKAIPGQDPGAVSGNDESNFETSDYVVLGVEEKDNETTVYLWIYYATFVKDGDPTELGVKDDGETGQVIHVGKDGVIEKTGGSHVPTAVTLRKVAKGDAEEYVTAEFWEPRDGGYFTKDIKGKFPRSLWDKAFDSQWCVEEQAERCREKAEKWFAKGTLSLDEAIRLSEEKGENLTWGDFEAYRYTVTGSGMYIRLYRMEDDFSVWIGGTTDQPDPKDTPAYVYLFYGETWLDGPESASKSEWVDLRTGDVRAFVEKMKGETPPEDENGETDGLTALSPLEDWIAGTEPGPERDEKLIALLRARSEYVKKVYLDGWYSPSAERATITWKKGTVEISDPEKLRALAAVLAPEALRAAVDSPEIYKAACGEGTLPSEEFQKAEMLYSGYSSVSNLLLDLHNGTVIAVLYDPGSGMETAELVVGRDGVFRKEDGSAEITPADGVSFPFPTNHVCYLADAKLLKVLEACLSDEPLPEELRAEGDPQALSPLESEAAKEAALKKEVWEAEREKALVRYDELTREKEDFEKTHDMKKLTEAEGKAYSAISEELWQIRRDYISPEPQKTVNDQFLEALGMRIELYNLLKGLWKKAGSETLDPEKFGNFYEESAETLFKINYLTVLEKRYLKGEDAGELLSAWRTVRISRVRFAEGMLQEEDWWDEVWNGGKLIPFVSEGTVLS